QEPTIFGAPVPGNMSPQVVDQPNLPECFYFSFFDYVQYKYEVLLPFDSTTGKILSVAAVSGLFPGENLNFKLTVFSVSATITLTLNFVYCPDDGFTDFQICLTGQIDIMIPFVGGQSVQFSICFGAPSYVVRVTLAASGFIANFNWSSNNSCVQTT